MPYLQRFSLAIMTSLFMVTYPLIASAEEAPTASKGVYTLGEIVVSGRPDGVETVSTINTITQEDINNIGAQNLVDVLKTIPGINIRMGGAGTPRIDIRGFKTRHVLLLLDGIPINETYDGQFDPTSFPVEHIAEVKVVTGGGSVLYGQGGSDHILGDGGDDRFLQLPGVTFYERPLSAIQGVNVLQGIAQNGTGMSVGTGEEKAGPVQVVDLFDPGGQAIVEPLG